MVLKGPVGPARAHPLSPVKLSWARIKMDHGLARLPVSPVLPGEAVGGVSNEQAPPTPLQSGVWRMFNTKCVRAESVPDLLGSGQRLKAMGLSVAEARECVVQPNAAWGEALAAAGGRRGVEFLLRATSDVLAAAHSKLAAGLMLPCVGGGADMRMATRCELAFTGSPRGSPSAALLATWRKRAAADDALSGADTPPRPSPGRGRGRATERGGRGRGRAGGQGPGSWGVGAVRQAGDSGATPLPPMPPRDGPSENGSPPGGGGGGAEPPAGGDGGSGNGGKGGTGGEAPGLQHCRDELAAFRDDLREFVFVEGLRHGAPNDAPRVRNFPEDTAYTDYREMVATALPLNHLDIQDAWLSAQKLGFVRLRCSLAVASSLAGNRFDLGLLGIWSLQPRGPKPGAPTEHDAVGQFSIDPEHLMEARAGSTGSATRAATLPRIRAERGSAEFVERRATFIQEFLRDLLSLGMAVLMLPFLPGQETQCEGPFFPLAGAVEMPHVRAAVAARLDRCPTFPFVTLTQTLAAASAVATPSGQAHPLQLQAHLPWGDKRPFPIDPRSMVDQIMSDATAAALNPVCFGDREQVGAALDTAPWGAQSMVLSMPGLEPDGCQALAALDKIAFKSPTGAVVKLAWGAAISDSSGLRRRLNRWFDEGRSRNGDRQLAAEESAGFATPVRGLFLDVNGVTQNRLRNEFGQAGLLNYDGTIKRRTGGQGTLSFAPTTPPREGDSSAEFSFGRTHGGSRRSSRRKKGGRRGEGSSGGSSSGGESAGSRPRRTRRLAGDFAKSGAAGQGGQGEDEIVIDLCMSEAALALLPKGGEGKPPTNTLAVSRGQEPAVLGLMQMMNSCVSTMLSAQNTALQASEARQTAALTTAVGDLKVHTEAKIAAETASIRQAFSIDEEAAKAHAAKLQGLREEELSAAEAARTRAVSHATATEAAEKVREERLAAEEVAADRAARVHADTLKAARDRELQRVLRRERLAEEEEEIMTNALARRKAAADAEKPATTPRRRLRGGPTARHAGPPIEDDSGNGSEVPSSSDGGGEGHREKRAARRAAREAGRSGGKSPSE